MGFGGTSVGDGDRIQSCRRDSRQHGENQTGCDYRFWMGGVTNLLIEARRAETGDMAAAPDLTETLRANIRTLLS